MLSIAKQTIEYYTKFKKAPQLSELKIENDSYTKIRGSIFVTLYQKGEVRGSAGNIQDLQSSLLQEVIDNTISALQDTRFTHLKLESDEKIKIRIDLIKERTILGAGGISKIDPVKSGILVIKKDYEKIACILPNINHSILTGDDFIPILKLKLGENNFTESDYHVYALSTETLMDF